MIYCMSATLVLNVVLFIEHSEVTYISITRGKLYHRRMPARKLKTVETADFPDFLANGPIIGPLAKESEKSQPLI